MSISMRKLGLATGAAILMSAATASGALAANPIVVSVTGNTLYINDPTGVTQATKVTTNTPGSWYEIEELNSSHALVEGPGAFAAVFWSDRHWIVGSASGTPITRIEVTGRGGADAINTTAVTDIPVTLLGGDGSDHLLAGPGNDTLHGGAGNDTLRGGAGNDVLNGGLGSDNLFGQNGDDKIFDKDGYADTVDGGNDYDEFTRDAGLDTASNIELYL